MDSKKIVIRADGSDSIGTGHIFRTMALANRLMASNREVIYLCRDLPVSLAKRMEKAGIEVVSIPDTTFFEDEKTFVLEYIEKVKPRWIIVDHYDVKEEYYISLRQAGAKIMAIDDINHTKFPVDVLLNQNINANEMNYRCNSNTIKLLGPRYALVRKVYRRKRKNTGIRKSIKRIMVFMGGADPNNQTQKVLKGIELSKRKVVVDVILGPAFMFKREIEKITSKDLLKYKVHCDIPDLANIMQRADLAIGTGGSTCWEMCTMKMPMILMPIAENQKGNAEGLDKAGAAINIGWWEDVTPEDISRVLKTISDKRVKEMSYHASSICSGDGVNKIVKILENENIRK